MPQSYFSSGSSTTATPAAAGSVTPDPSAYGVYTVTMPAGNITIANPATAAQGNSLMFIFTQDGVGSRTITWGSKFKTAWNPASAANSISSIGFWYDGTNWQMYGPSSFDNSGNSTETTTGAPGSGTAQLTAPMSLAGTANTVVTGTLIASPNTLAVGDRISLLFAGTVTNLAGCTVTLTLKRCLWP